jgi:hypothetical protein
MLSGALPDTGQSELKTSFGGRVQGWYSPQIWVCVLGIEERITVKI